MIRDILQVLLYTLYNANDYYNYILLQAVLLFMGILDVSWESMRKFLAKSSVKDEIINFDARRIANDVAKKVNALVQSKPASFDPKNARRASMAAAPLAAWVTANLQYAAIVQKIAPLEQKKNALKENLDRAERDVSHQNYYCRFGPLISKGRQ